MLCDVKMLACINVGLYNKIIIIIHMHSSVIMIVVCECSKLQSPQSRLSQAQVLHVTLALVCFYWDKEPLLACNKFTLAYYHV